AELAWEMNLPLPEKYKFVRIAAHCVGGAGTGNMFRACGVYYEWDGWINDGKNVYIKNYHFLLQDKHMHKALDISDYFYKDCIKYFNLIQNDQCYYLICTRDPIEQFKTSFNFPLIHHDRKPNYINLNDLDIYNRLNNVLERVYTFNSKIYSRYDLNYFLEFNLSRICIYTTAIKYFKKAKKLYFLDNKLIDPKVAYNTFKILSKELNFNKPTLDKMAFFSFKSFNTCLAYLFPLTLVINKNIKLIFCTYQNHFMEDINYINLKKILSIKDEYFKNIIIYINREDFYKLNNKLILNIEVYCNHIIKVLKNIDLAYKKHGVTEKDIIDFCKNNANFRYKVKKIFNKELAYIKQHRPDIVASWKYYQEFEQMCKELDGDI
ncbi:hypothetical protein C3H36_06875, partial [Campylobacter jejuni]|uniref:DUF2972 domain-containing protein n=1 Tax=Campylobacter jejuni TaxID=197 RepID=UPI001002B542